MKNVSQKSRLQFWSEVVGVALVLLVVCSQSAEAQSNTFPSSGNAGIGTTTPSAALQVNSTSAGVAAVKVKGAPSQTANLFEFRTSDDSLRSYVNPAGALFFNPAHGSGLFRHHHHAKLQWRLLRWRRTQCLHNQRR